MFQEIALQKIYECIMGTPISKNSFYNAIRIGFLTDKLLGINLGTFAYQWIHDHPISGAMAAIIQSEVEYEAEFVIREDIQPILNEFNSFLESCPSIIEKEKLIEITAFIVFHYYKVKKEHSYYFEIYKNKGKDAACKYFIQKVSKYNENNYDMEIVETIINNLAKYNFYFLTEDMYSGGIIFTK